MDKPYLLTDDEKDFIVESVKDHANGLRWYIADCKHGELGKIMRKDLDGMVGRVLGKLGES